MTIKNGIKIRKKQMSPDLDKDISMQFWDTQAAQLAWFKKWDKTLVWQEPEAQWFAGGQLNAAYNCVDVHVQGSGRDKIAIYWESETGESVSWTYHDLYKQVNSYAYQLQQQGVKKGDIVILYLPMIPESVAAILAVARLGAVHSIVFSGFSSQALRDRINDTQAKYVITADIGYRRGKKLLLKKIVDNALEGQESLSCVEFVFVIKREPETSCSGVVCPERDVILRDYARLALERKHDIFVDPVPVDSIHPLFILYTSGTTGKPKGIVHSTGGYLTYVRATFQWAFDIKPETIYWCTADIGWITGHSYGIYAPLLHGITMVMHEGALDYPDAGIWWQLIEKYKISVFYTSPTALRLCMKFGDQWPEKYDLSSLRVLGSVGEVINPEVWRWYHEKIGNCQCPISDTWWQTETGGFMISPVPGLNTIKLKPGSATFPLPHIDVDIVDKDGNSLPAETKGFLIVKSLWPGMALGIYNDNERFKEVYWSKFKHAYYSGDYAIKDRDGYFWLLGRADEVLNVSGHRVGTAEIESSVATCPYIAESAAIGVHDDITGEAVVLFVVLKNNAQELSDAKKMPDMSGIITQVLREQIGAFVKPRDIYFLSTLPKTRSGKIMRRLLKAVVQGNAMGDMSTLEDETSLDQIKMLCDLVKLPIK
ncbi:MAG: acetate--CoA ligase [bacterium]